jgi:DNA-binding MarR family transcriptional regulator
MSLKASFWAIERRPRSQSHKLILMLLADWANEEGIAWPKLTTIADKAMCSVSTVQRCLRDLEADGFISRSNSRRRDGRQGTNFYKLDLSEVN